MYNRCRWFCSKTSQISRRLWNPVHTRRQYYNSIKTFLPYNKNFKNIEGFKFTSFFIKANYSCSEYTSDFKAKFNEIQEQINNNNSKITDGLNNPQKKVILNKISKLEEKQIKIGNIERVQKVKLYFNRWQRYILFKWLKECLKVYNFVIDMYNNNDPDFNLDYKKMKVKVFNRIYRKKNRNGKKIKKPAPYDILTGEIKDACAHIQACLTNLEKGHIKKFSMKKKNLEDFKERSITIPSKSITKIGIYTRLLGKNYHKCLEDVKKDSKLKLYFSKTRIYKTVLHISVLKNITEDNYKKEKIGVLDPGSKIFMTCYSPNSCAFLGENIDVVINEYYDEIKELQSALDTNKNKQGKSIKHKGRLKWKINYYYTKISNITDNLRKQSAKFLCKNYETIMLPKFGVKKMISKEDGNLNYPAGLTTKTVMNLLGHYKFRCHMYQKAEEYGNRMLVVTEECTSQCCCRCGYLSNNYDKNRIKICPICKHKIHRDLNGSKNILLLNNAKVNFKFN